MKRYWVLPLTILATTAFGATTYTQYYNLAKPGDGDTNYGALIRSNFDTIDTQLQIATGGIGSILTTKGDLITRDASVVTRLPVGSDFQVLEADSSQATGLKWVTVNIDGSTQISGVVPVANGGTGGLLPIANGGTGQTTANSALNALLPTQTSNSGKALTTNGSTTSWSSIVTNPMTTTGDIIYSSDNSGTPARLAAGSSGQWLVSGGVAAPSWSDTVTTSKTISAATTLGDSTSGSAHTIYVADGSSATVDGRYTAASSSNPILKVQRNGGAVAGAFGYSDSATGMYLGTTTTHPFSLRTNNTDRFSISSSGAVSVSSLTKGIVESSSAGVLSSNNVWTSSAGVFGTTCSVNGSCAGTTTFGGGISTISRSATGVYSADFTASFWSSAPICVATTNSLNSVICTIGNTSTTSAPVSCFTSSTGAAVDARPAVVCQGPRS